MKQHAPAGKAPKTSASDGEKAVALAPPAYGIDFVDHGGQADPTAAAGKFIVDDDAIAGPGQVGKSGFLAALKLSIAEMAEQVLGRIGQDAGDCPYIPYWFGYYADKDAAHVETAIRRYAPDSMSAGDWQECLAGVVAEVRAAFEAHLASGSMEGVPEEAPDDLLQREASGGVAQRCKPKDPDVTAAKAVFKRSPVVNRTRLSYLLFSDLVSSNLGELQSGTLREGVPDHVVNKWERSEAGEALGDYAMPLDDKSRDTSRGEARQLGYEKSQYGAYEALESRLKMQFALLDFDDRKHSQYVGWGRSYYVISKQKCMADGSIHFGDSAVHLFNKSKGRYAHFEASLKTDPEAVQILNRAQDIAWIEVVFGGGIDVPGDVDKLVVNRQELNEAAGLLEGGSYEDKLQRVRDALEGSLGSDKVDYW